MSQAEQEIGANDSSDVLLNQSNQTEQPKVILYDADATQRIPFMTEHDGELYEIAYIVAPRKDDDIKEFETRRNMRLAEADPDETGGRGGTITENDSLQAAEWLFDKLATGVEGVGDSDEELPEDWKTNFSQQEKSAVINQGLLACEAVEPLRVKSGKRLPLNHQKSTGATTLRVLFNGHQLTTKHTIADADADTLAEYSTLMSRSVLIQGSMVGQGESYIPSRMGKLGIIYDRLKESVTGYAGRVPLDHKAAVVMGKLGKQQKALQKK